MARGDVWIHDRSGYAVVPTQQWSTAVGSLQVKQGEPAKINATFAYLANHIVDADITIATDTRLLGVAQSDSNETASATGTFEFYVPLAGVRYATKATTSTNFDTASEIEALKGNRVTWDVAASVITLDENDSDGVTNALCIVGGVASEAVVHYVITNDATYLGQNN